MSIDLDAIRARHDDGERDIDAGSWTELDGIDAHVDRGLLLAEVDQLAEALRRARRALAGTKDGG